MTKKIEITKIILANKSKRTTKQDGPTCKPWTIVSTNAETWNRQIACEKEAEGGEDSGNG